MPDIQAIVEEQLRAATVRALGSEYADVDPLVRPADPQFGDYQANIALPLAKRVGRKPRDIAQAIAQAVPECGDVASHVEVAGPGFINLKLNDEFVVDRVRMAAQDERLGVEMPAAGQKVVVDYASPNLAKEMHIGHLRSSILGDSIVRCLEFAGYAVIRQNHIGDWGTQFGMLLEHLLDTGWERSAEHTLSDLNQLYQEAKARFDAEPEFADRARRRVVTLQAGDEHSLSYWRQLIDESCAHMNEVFSLLGLRMRDEDIRGESFFNSRLAAVITDLQASGVLVESDSAKVAFCEGYTNKEGNPLPLIVQKSDGGYGYATTDLAAGRYRVQELGADRVVYVVGAPQSDHFGMLFQTLRRAGWAPEGVRLEHVAFGAILGKDGKAFKTRAGESVKLVDVLQEAVSRARQALEERGRGDELSEEELSRIAKAVGIGAVKYADLSSDRIKDYVFDYDRMLSMEGNTAPYLQYAYARIRSIFRKADGVVATPEDIAVTHPVERSLMLELLRLPRVIDSVVETLEPHRLCTYLYEVAGHVHQFHQNCPVLRAPDEATKKSRLALSDLAARVIALGLSMLGVDVIERM